MTRGYLLAGILLAGLTAATSATDAEPDRSALTAILGDRPACFIVQDAKSRRDLVEIGGDRCGVRLPPCSTFKIPNTIIGLAEGRVSLNPEERFAWNGKLRRFRAWEGDKTLREAFAGSVVWVYQEIARRVGEDAYRKRLQELRYGNADPSSGLTTFWLGPSVGGSLLISPREQIAFLSGLYRGDLEAPEAAMNLTRELAVSERTAGVTLSGKTGTCEVRAGSRRTIAWFVGAVERQGEASVFSLSFESDRGETGRDARAITRRLLQAMGGLLP